MLEFDSYIQKTFEDHRKAFESGKTHSREFRVEQLKKIVKLLTENDNAIVDALREDYLKPKHEIMNEINYCISKTNHTIYNLSSWMKPIKIPTDTFNMNVNASSVPEPYGTVLIIAPFNFPLILSIEPLIGAIAAGNTVILKTSELVPKLSEFMKKLFENYLDNDCVTIVDEPFCGEKLTKMRFDYILFTGGTKVGKLVMKAASEMLIPVTLELGGQCPAYVHHDCDIQHTAKKVAHNMTANAGQMCVSIEYVCCHKKVLDDFVKNLTACFFNFYTEDIKASPDYGRIVTKEKTATIEKLINESTDEKVFGGTVDVEDQYVEPTVFICRDRSSKTLTEEAFGPILTILPVEDEEDAIKFIKTKEKPLQVYVFAKSSQIVDKFIKNTSSGGVTVNEGFLQMAITELPFGGVGMSGMGTYHGFSSFKCFSHYKSLYSTTMKNYMLEGLIYPPYTQKAINTSTRFLRSTLSYSCCII